MEPTPRPKLQVSNIQQVQSAWDRWMEALQVPIYQLKQCAKKLSDNPEPDPEPKYFFQMFRVYLSPLPMGKLSFYTF